MKELEQNIQEVKQVFERIKAYPIKEMKEFYHEVSEALEALDEVRIHKSAEMESKKVVADLTRMFGI